jgi:hypothetical protein
MTQITGRCLCGAVTYTTEASPDLERTLVCHCTTCQRHVGSAFGTFMFFPAGSVITTGALTTYTEPGGVSRQPIHRRFCPGCGTPIILQREGSAWMLIAAGTLDDTSIVRPRVNLFCESAQPWVPITPDTQNLPRYFA